MDAIRRLAGPAPLYTDGGLAVLRVIVDPADRVIPASVLGALDDRGKTRPLALIGALLRRPADIPAVLALARDHAAARKSLRRAAAGLGRILSQGQE